jgi:hypothetical protein
MVEGALAVTHEPEVATAPPAVEIPDFEIVPRLGLVFAAIAVVAIVVFIAIDKLFPLVFLHVSFGAAWTIIDLFLGFVLGPIMGAMPPPARIQFVTRLMPKMLVIMPIVVSVTLAIGWQLASHMGTVLTTYPHHSWIVASFIVVGVMAVLALGLLEPANIAVLIELKKRRPRPEVIERLMKRFMYCAGVLGAMQVATLVIMTRIASF